MTSRIRNRWQQLSNRYSASSRMLGFMYFPMWRPRPYYGSDYREMEFRFPGREKYYLFPLRADRLWGISTGYFSFPRQESKRCMKTTHILLASRLKRVEFYLHSEFTSTRKCTVLWHITYWTQATIERQQGTDGIMM